MGEPTGSSRGLGVFFSPNALQPNVFCFNAGLW